MTDIIYDDSCLNLPPRLTFDEWIGHGKTLATMTDSIPWWVGDWINFGEARFGEGKYSQGLTLWDYNYNTLANMAWVASRYPPETRTGLSWTHHRYAASLEPVERKMLLEKAIDEEWTSRQLQIEVAKARLKDTGDEEEVAVWVKYTVEIETNKRSIKKSANNINQFLIAVNELKELIDPPAVKVLEVGTCGATERS